MKKVIVFGASINHGVGSTTGSWVEQLKRDVHGKLYSPGGEGETTHVHSYCMPGATVDHFLDKLDTLFDLTSLPGPDDQILAVVSLGMNNAKAVDDPKAYVSTPDEFKAQIAALIKKIAEHTENIICFGFTPVDESKSYPKVNPTTGGDSYFGNERIKLFEDAFAEACKELNVDFIPVFEEAQKAVLAEQMYEVDGLHPKATAQQWLHNHLSPTILKKLNSFDD